MLPGRHVSRRFRSSSFRYEQQSRTWYAHSLHPSEEKRYGDGTVVTALLSPPRVVQGASAVLPGLHTAATSQERAYTPGGAAGLAEVYRDRDDGGGGAGAPRLTMVSSTASEVGGGEEEWESANDRIEASLRGGVSLTSLDVSSPRITVEFIKR